MQSELSDLKNLQSTYVYQPPSILQESTMKVELVDDPADDCTIIRSFRYTSLQPLVRFSCGSGNVLNAETIPEHPAISNSCPLRFDCPGADSKAVVSCIEDQDYMGSIKQLQDYLDKVRNIVKPGCSPEVLEAALSVMAALVDELSAMSFSTSLKGRSSL